MKILLIGINSKYIHPAVGIHQIVANSKFPVTFLEFSIKDNNENILAAMGKENFQVIGFSVYIWNIGKIKDIIKSYSRETIFILGGPEASYRPELLLFDRRVRFIIKNEGEEAYNELIEYLNNERDIKEVSNLYYLSQNKITYTFNRMPDLSKIRHDLGLIKDFKNRVFYLEASRGCPFYCSYCLSSLEKTVRFFNLEKVKEEIVFALDKKVRVLKFLDRTFNLRQTNMRKLLSFIRDHDNHLTTFQFEIVADLLEEETIELLQTIRRGQIRFEIGVQSTNEIVTKAVRRKQDFQKLKENVLRIKNNIIIHLDLIAGLPYEDRQSFIRTFNETFELFGDEIQLGFLKELQGTEISIHKDLHGYKFSLLPPYEVQSNSYLSKADLDEIKIVNSAVNKYYNSGDYPKTMEYLFQKLHLNPYFTFLKIGNFIGVSNLLKMQIDEISKALYKALKDEVSAELLYIIKQDYLLKPIKPKIWWERNISREERKNVYQEFLKTFPKLNSEILYRYSHLEKYENEYLLITYKPSALFILRV